MDEKKEYIQNLLEILLKNSQLDNESSGKKWIADWIDSWVDIFRALSTDFKSKKKQLYYENYESAKYLKKGDETDVEQRFTDPYFLGQIELNEYETLNIYTIRCKDTLSERSSKKIQYEISKCILKNDSNYEVNLSGGIFIFYDTKAAFRFSLIYDIPYGTKRLWSNFRRYTYFVSKDQTNKTFIDRLSSCAFKSLENVIDAFSVEKVTKDFYTELENWYFWAMDKVRFPDDYLTLLSKGEESYLSSKKESLKVTGADELLSNNLIRLITRIIFIWFLKQKNLINNSFFDETYLNTIIKDFKKGNNYYNAILQNLFFATLNQHIKNRAFIDEGDFETNKKQYGVKTLFRYKDRFKIPESEVLKLFSDIPFVNGGLFECLDQEYEKKEDGKSFVIYIDGFSRNPRKQAIIPDKLFFDEQISYQDLSRFGLNSKSSIRGLINILSSYNFTIDENTPQDLEVALDPELLGKVFENLLASYNPETSTSARKATGSYYTPREIVDYMALETIVMYLNQRTNISDKVLRELFSYNDLNDLEVKLTSDEVKSLIDAINQMKVLDPACGSGAFPMGILHKLVYLLERIDPDNKHFKVLQYNIAIKEAEDAFQQNDKEKRKNKLEEINDIFDEKINYPDYARKLFLIENCIYGVDIQPIAVQITKLRFFISLLIDQKTSKDKNNNFGIRALPNLETRFISANTLIGLEKPENNDVFLLENIEDLENELKNLRNSYFEAKTREDKLSKQTEDKDLREKIEAKLIELGYNDMESHKIASFDPYDLNAHASWFDPEWMFGVKEGFDIVIGNPPYIQLQKAYNSTKKFADLYKDQRYITFDRMGDIYCLFYERGLQLLKDYGYLAFITSNKWMSAGYGEKLRKFFLNYNPKILIDLGADVFENATVDTNIFIIEKSSYKKETKGITIYEKSKDSIDFFEKVRDKAVLLDKLNEDAWFIGNDAQQRLKAKIEKIGKPLKEWDVNIYRGVLTGLNEAFIIDNAKRKEILNNCKDEEERKRTEVIIKPILRGRDIKRYYYDWAGLWVIVIPLGWTNENKNKENAENFINKQFPALMNHLKQFETKAKKRDDQGDYWWELRACAYYPEFEKEKVVWQELAQGAQFAFDDKEEFFVSNTAYILTGEKLKYILGYLNSKLNEFTFEKWYCTKLGGKGIRWLNQHVTEIPIPSITSNNQPIVSQIEYLVDKILATKKDNPSADTGEWEREIDKLVYGLYELRQEEIKIVEGNKG